MTIYIDRDYKCHTATADGLTAVDTDYFDGKCQAYIEGYRFVPAGQTWTRPDGVVFSGEMVSHWKSWRELDTAQRAYELEQLESLSAQNAELLDAMAAMVEDIYNQDVSEIGGEQRYVCCIHKFIFWREKYVQDHENFDWKEILQKNRGCQRTGGHVLF